MKTATAFWGSSGYGTKTERTCVDPSTPSTAVIAAIVAVIVAIMAEVPAAFPVPVMVVLNTTMVTVPIPPEEFSFVISWRGPVGAGIGRARPISAMPPVASVHWIPVTVYPKIIWAGGSGTGVNDAGRRWRPNSHAKR